MAYDIKDVFYLSTGMTLATGDAGATSGQLFLTGSGVLQATDATLASFDILCLKK